MSWSAHAWLDSDSCCMSSCGRLVVLLNTKICGAVQFAQNYKIWAVAQCMNSNISIKDVKSDGLLRRINCHKAVLLCSAPCIFVRSSLESERNDVDHTVSAVSLLGTIKLACILYNSLYSFHSFITKAYRLEPLCQFRFSMHGIPWVCLQIDEGVDTGNKIQNLPPIKLVLKLTPAYPSQELPNITVTAIWLSKEQQTSLHKSLCQELGDYVGGPVAYAAASWLQNTALQILQNSDKLILPNDNDSLPGQLAFSRNTQQVLIQTWAQNIITMVR